MKKENENNKLLIKNYSQVQNIKTKLIMVDFARACSTIGIIIFHYFDNFKNSSYIFLYRTKNSHWGTMLVTVFFAISGMVLYHNYSYIHSFKSFYFKRWKSIFPAYYLCFLFFFTRNVIKMKKVFYKGNKISLLFTLFGMDGYFDYLMKTYYLIGQWFLGAIIIIYLLYPLILYISFTIKY